jgi:predicted cobalt transporter CbtA
MPNRVLRAGLLAGLIVGVLVFLIHIALVLPIALRATVMQDSDDPPDASIDWMSTLLGDIGTAMGYGLLLAAVFALIGRRTTIASGALAGFIGFVCLWLLPGLIWTPELPGAATEAATPEVAADFIMAMAFMVLTRWVALGMVASWLFERFGPAPPGPRGTTVDISA